MKKPKQPPLSPHPKTEADWKAWLAHDMAFAVERLVQAGEVRPFFALHTREDVMLLPAAWHDQQSKESIYAMAKMIAIAYDVVAISLTIEAWMRMVDRRPRESDAEHRERSEAIAPSEAEDRIEVVVVTLTYRDDDGCHALGDMIEIVRGGDGKPSGVKPVSFPSDPGVEGAMVDILPVKRAPEPVRSLARDFLRKMGVVTEPIRRPS